MWGAVSTNVGSDFHCLCSFTLSDLLLCSHGCICGRGPKPYVCGLVWALVFLSFCKPRWDLEHGLWTNEERVKPTAHVNEGDLEHGRWTKEERVKPTVHANEGDLGHGLWTNEERVETTAHVNEEEETLRRYWVPCNIRPLYIIKEQGREQGTSLQGTRNIFKEQGRD